jgi:queuine/archaeosine tRNA-ribosyltransferase
MFTPISQGEGSHKTIRNIQEEYGLNIMFDSGGYEVQVGNYEFDDLYSYLLDFYEDNRWGHRYVLPDHVPVSADEPELVDKKVNETISASRMCFRRLPEEVKSSAVAVIQGHAKEQLSRCLNAYGQFVGLQYVGFGSFSTSGVSQGVNMLTRDSFDNLEWTTQRAHDNGLKVHAFGIGGPTSIPLLYEAGVDSFDSTTWMRSSGYGNVFFPFKSRLNASHRRKRGKVLKSSELPHLKAETNHECPFCEDISNLRNNRWDRIMHNLIVTHELSKRVTEMSRKEVIAAMDANSRYRKQLEDLQGTPNRITS